MVRHLVGIFYSSDTTHACHASSAPAHHTTPHLPHLQGQKEGRDDGRLHPWDRLGRTRAAHSPPFFNHWTPRAEQALYGAGTSISLTPGADICRYSGDGAGRWRALPPRAHRTPTCLLGRDGRNGKASTFCLVDGGTFTVYHRRTPRHTRHTRTLTA